jgi:hypothetical protein
MNQGEHTKSDEQDEDSLCGFEYRNGAETERVVGVRHEANRFSFW